MNRQRVYDRTNNYLTGRWTSIIVIILLISFAESLLGSVLGAGSAFDIFKLGTALKSDSPISSIIALTGTGSRRFFVGLIKSFVSLLLSGSFAVTLFKVVEKNEDITVSDIVDNAQRYLMPLVVSGFITSIILSFVGLIPILGTIISIVIGYALGFRLFLIADETTDNGWESITKSFYETSGYKMDLFMLDVKYLGLPLGIFIAGVIISFIFISVPSLMVVILFTSGIAATILLFYFVPYLYVAQVITYLESKGE